MTAAARWTMGLAVAVTWLGLVAIAIPGTFSDQGIYASTAELLLRGHRLYVEVWDNKGPVFYYLNALARAVSPILVIPLEVGWLALCCVAAWMLAHELPARGRLALSWIAVPIIVTGLRYDPGMTELPGVALALLAVAFSFRGRFAWGGAALGALALVKLVFVPVAGLAVLLLLVRSRKARSAWAAFGAASLVVTCGVLVMAARGELTGYATMLTRNAAYATSSGDGGSGLAGQLLTNLMESTPPGVIAACLVGVTLLLVPHPSPTGASPRTDSSAVAAMLFLGVGVVLTLTGKWAHHGTAWAIPLVVTAVHAASLVPALGAMAAWRRKAIVAAGVLLLSSWTPVTLLHAVEMAGPRLHSLTTISPEGSALADLGEGDTYARVGSNSDRAHAYGMGPWRLGCPDFHQYDFQPSPLLNETSDCLESVDTVIIAPDAVPKPGATDWNRYLEDVDALMAADFRCTVSEERVRVCVKA